MEEMEIFAFIIARVATNDMYCSIAYDDASDFTITDAISLYAKMYEIDEEDITKVYLTKWIKLGIVNPVYPIISYDYTFSLDRKKILSIDKYKYVFNLIINWINADNVNRHVLDVMIGEKLFLLDKVKHYMMKQTIESYAISPSDSREDIVKKCMNYINYVLGFDLELWQKKMIRGILSNNASKVIDDVGRYVVCMDKEE